MRKYINHIKTKQSVTLIFSEGNPVVVPAENADYKKICDALDAGDYQRVGEIADAAVWAATNTKGKFAVNITEDGKVEAKYKDLPPALQKRLVSFVAARQDTGPLEKFWNRLKENPSPSSREDLFAFIEHNHIPLTPDGHFIGYKKVRDDYLDKHSGRYSNKPGSVVQMPREQVDPNRNNTCSHGLHVAAYNYAATQMSGGRMVLVKVDPVDVVAVPPDYDQQKMRVCRYTVISDSDGKNEIEEPVIVPPEISEPTIVDAPDPGSPGYDHVTENRKKGLRAKVKASKQTQTKGKSKKIRAVFLAPDGKGGLRLPENMLVSARLTLHQSAYIKDPRSRNVLVVGRAPKKVFFSVDLSRQSNGGVRLPLEVLRQAKIDGAKQYRIRVDRGEIEIRKA